MDLRWYISILGHLEFFKILYDIFLGYLIFQNIIFVHGIQVSLATMYWQ